MSGARAISLADVGVLASLPFLMALSWTVPPRAWPSVATLFAPLAGRFLSREASAVARRMGTVDAEGSAAGSPRALAKDLFAQHIERELAGLRLYRPAGWRPQLRLLGSQHIDAGLGAGKGVVLWDSHFTHAAVFTKMALARQGYAVSHLSQPSHGYSDTRFGVAVLNPVRTRLESRFLRERVVMAPEQPIAAMRILARRLSENGVVSVTARGKGQQPMTLPFLGDTTAIALGAPYLAFSAGAPVLPVFTVSEAPGAFTITVEAPLDGGGHPERRAHCEAIARDYVARLERYVLRAPEQWLGWGET